MFFGILSLTDYCIRHKLNEKERTELITTVACLQAVGMVIGFFACLILVAVLRIIGWF